MKIEKSSCSEIYVVENEVYDIVIQHQKNINLGYSEWQILCIENKDGLEVRLSKDVEN